MTNAHVVEGTTGNAKAKRTHAAVLTGGAVAGAGGSYTIFTIAHLDKIFENTGGTFVGMLYAIAVFCALGLLVLFMQGHQAADEGRAPDAAREFSAMQLIQLSVAVVFGVVVIAAIGILCFRTAKAPDLPVCKGTLCKADKVLVDTVFANYSEVAGFSFPLNPVDDGNPLVVRANLNDGAPRSFDKDGKFPLQIDRVQSKVTFAVENLNTLEVTFKSLQRELRGLLDREKSFSKACKTQVNSPKLSGDCQILFETMVLNPGD